MSNETPAPGRSAHLANGPIVAEVRRWLENHDAASGQWNERILSRAGGSLGRELDLTVGHVRTLLIEHDAYRSEARGWADSPSRTCGAKSWPVGTYTCDRTVGHNGDHGAGTATRYQWPQHATVEPSAGGHATSTADYVRDVLTNPDATETEMRGAALAAYVALRQTAEGA